jgi:apoptotic chromatin condensation inducer in the nucleus
MSAPRICTPGQIKVPELKEELRKRGITPKGLKKDLVEKLEEFLRNEG